MNLMWWFYLLGFFIVGWGVSIALEPFHSVPHIKLCNIHKECQNILLVVDTGSTDIWLADISCKTCDQNPIKCLPDPIVHNAFEESPGKWVSLKQKEIQYGVGWVKGYEVDFPICGIITKVLCVTSSKNIQNFASNGVLGIGGNSTGAHFLSNLIERFNTTRSISMLFSAYFSQLTIGGFNYDYVKQVTDIEYYNTNTDWTLQVTKLKIGSLQLNSRIVALLDSGSSMIVLPEDFFNKFFYDLLKTINHPCSIQNHGIVCTCPDSSWINKFPSISITFKNKNKTRQYSLSSKLYVQWQKGSCTASLTSLIKYQGILILGRPFLKQYITLFDMQLTRLGLAEANLQKVKTAQTSNIYIVAGLLTLVILVFSYRVVRYFTRQIG